MLGRYFLIAEDGRLQERPLTEAQPDGDVAAWVDLCDFDSAALMQFLGRYRLHALVLEAVDTSLPLSHIAVHHNAVLLQLPAAQCDGDSERLSMIVVGKNLITLHRHPVAALEQFIEQFHDFTLQASDVPALVIELLYYVADDCIKQSLTLRSQVNALEQSLDVNDDQYDPDVTRQLREDVVAYEAMLDDQYHAVMRMQALNVAPFNQPSLEMKVHQLLSRLEHSTRVVSRLADRLSVLQQHYLLLLEERQNEKLHVLTIVSAVFLPLTLIAGIYGMNFNHMPELQWRYGYLGVLLVMGSLAAALVWVFYKKGWFK